MVVTQIVKAGITWLISMLNPAAAFIKACKMIYDVVMFFVEKADQIKEFVDSVLDSVESIVGGGVGAVASKIEQTLAKMLPVLIGFLASLLGLGGISEKIKKIIETVQKPVNRAVDWVIGKAVQYGKKFLGGAAKKVKGKIAAGKAYVKGKVQAGKAYVKGKVASVKERFAREGQRGGTKGGTAEDGAAAARVIAQVAASSVGRRDADSHVRTAAVEAGRDHLAGQGMIEVIGMPVVQRTSVNIVKKPRAIPGAEEVAVRRSEPVNPESAAKILSLIQKRMPRLLADFEKSNSKRARLALLEQRFTEFMQGREGKRLTSAERKRALDILGEARTLSRKYYEQFRDQAWSQLREDDALKALVAAQGSRAKWGKNASSSLTIEVRVTRADGRKLPPEFRSIDFEHLTRVTDQPFRKHSESGGQRPNLSPMLADANRYYNEAVRNLLGAHMFGGDTIERFIVAHQLYPAGSPALRDLAFGPGTRS
jgi:hypothetical protein